MVTIVSNFFQSSANDMTYIKYASEYLVYTIVFTNITNSLENFSAQNITCSLQLCILQFMKLAFFPLLLSNLSLCTTYMYIVTVTT